MYISNQYIVQCKLVQLHWIIISHKAVISLLNLRRRLFEKKSYPIFFFFLRGQKRLPEFFQFEEIESFRFCGQIPKCCLCKDIFIEEITQIQNAHFSGTYIFISRHLFLPLLNVPVK